MGAGQGLRADRHMYALAQICYVGPSTVRHVPLNLDMCRYSKTCEVGGRGECMDTDVILGRMDAWTETGRTIAQMLVAIPFAVIWVCCLLPAKRYKPLSEERAHINPK